MPKNHFKYFEVKGGLYICKNDILKMLLKYEKKCDINQKEVVNPIIQMVVEVGEKYE